VLLTDIVMPGGTGTELATEIAALRPGLPTVFVTGHASQDAIQNVAADRRAALVRKPFTEAELLEAIAGAAASNRSTR